MYVDCVGIKGYTIIKFQDVSTSEIIGIRNDCFLMIMVANNIRGWIGPKFFRHLS